MSVLFLQIMNDPFFQGYCPSKLPISSLTMAPRFTDMPTTGGIPTRKPLSEFNGRPSEGLLRSIPEGKKTDPLNNVSHAVCVKDGIGHDVAEDPCMETDNGRHESFVCFQFVLSRLVRISSY